MKLLIHLVAILAAATAIQVYHQPTFQQVQPIENYAHSAEIYQAAQEFQQQGLFPGQSQGFGHQEESYQSRPSGEKTAKILHYNMDNDGHNYQYSYETDNGIKQQEVGQTIDGTKAQGEYSYTGDDGHVYSVSYTADENGFRAQGAHLPTPPPLPEAIARSLEQNAKDEASGIFLMMVNTDLNQKPKVIINSTSLNKTSLKANINRMLASTHHSWPKSLRSTINISDVEFLTNITNAKVSLLRFHA